MLVVYINNHKNLRAQNPLYKYKMSITKNQLVSDTMKRIVKSLTGMEVVSPSLIERPNKELISYDEVPNEVKILATVLFNPKEVFKVERFSNVAWRILLEFSRKENIVVSVDSAYGLDCGYKKDFEVFFPMKNVTARTQEELKYILSKTRIIRMKVAQIRKYDIANGDGIRTSLFVSGCNFNCKGCFNKEYQNFDYGELWSKEHFDKIIDYLKEPEIEGLTILGGEPMEHAIDLYNILSEVKNITDKNVWLYSGYTLEEIQKDPNKKDLLNFIDTLVDGRFIQELKDLTLKFRGSSNQRILDKINEKFVERIL